MKYLIMFVTKKKLTYHFHVHPQQKFPYLDIVWIMVALKQLQQYIMNNQNPSTSMQPILFVRL
jgi:hypothetical protein